ELMRAERLALEHNDRICLSLINSTVTYAEIIGSDAPVLAHARQALEVAEPVGYALAVNQAWASIGVGHSLEGQWHEARAALEDPLELMRDRRTGLFTEAQALTHLARVQLRLGEVEQARSTINEAVLAGQEHNTRVFEIFAHLERARILREIEGSGG